MWYIYVYIIYTVSCFKANPIENCHDSQSICRVILIVVFFTLPVIEAVADCRKHTHTRYIHIYKAVYGYTWEFYIYIILLFFFCQRARAEHEVQAGGAEQSSIYLSECIVIILKFIIKLILIVIMRMLKWPLSVRGTHTHWHTHTCIRHCGQLNFFIDFNLFIQHFCTNMRQERVLHVYPAR